MNQGIIEKKHVGHSTRGGNTPPLANQNARTMQPKKFNLQNVISGRYNDPEKGWIDHEFDLSTQQKMELANLLTERTRHNTKLSICDWTMHLRSCGSFWAWERIMWTGSRWEYFAGQDYPAEIRLIRNWIKLRY